MNINIMDRIKAGVASVRASVKDPLTEDDAKTLADVEAKLFGKSEDEKLSDVTAPAVSAETLAALAEADDKIKALTGDLEAERQAKADLLAKSQLDAQTANESHIQSLLMDFKRDGKLHPAADKPALELFQREEKAFTAFLELNGVTAAFGGSPKEAPKTMPGAEAAATMESAREDQTLHNLALARAKADGLPYVEALKLVAIENKALVESMTQNLPVLG